MTERIVIEEVLTLRQEALRSTVVRKENSSVGFWVSTIPSEVGHIQGRNSFETQVFKFTGYAQRVGKTGIPNVDLKYDPELTIRWASLDAFEEDLDSAIEYHHQVVNEVADSVESEELI
ncbi:MAG: hypothetical protein AAB675_00980 [Patescibacteria group bacterium]